MKKTLITLAALAMVSVAQSATDMSTVLNIHGNYEATNGGTYDATTYNGTSKVYLWGNTATFEVSDASKSVSFVYVQGYAGANLIKSGDGKLIINDAIDGAPGMMTVNAGTLHVGDSHGARYAYNYTANKGGTLELGTAGTLYADSITLNSGSKLTLQGTSQTRNLAETGTIKIGAGSTIDLSSWETSSSAWAESSTALFSKVTSISGSSVVTLDFGEGDKALYTLAVTEEGMLTTTELASSQILASGEVYTFGSKDVVTMSGPLTVYDGAIIDLSAWETSVYEYARDTQLFEGVSELVLLNEDGTDIGTGLVYIDFGDGKLWENWLYQNGTGVYSIPEPATATLSLLALAGLAARRRRK